MKQFLTWFLTVVLSTAVATFWQRHEQAVKTAEALDIINGLQHEQAGKDKDPLVAAMEEAEARGRASRRQQVAEAEAHEALLADVIRESEAMHASELAAGQPTQAEAVARRARVQAAIARHELVIGMTTLEAMRALPAPQKINPARTAAGVASEQWVYGEDQGRKVVHFENDVITAIQD